MEGKYQKLTKSYSDLSRKIENNQILREEINSLKVQVEMMKSLREKIAKLEVENMVLKEERNEWSQYLDGLEEFKTPADITRILATQRLEILDLREKLINSNISITKF